MSDAADVAAKAASADAAWDELNRALHSFTKRDVSIVEAECDKSK